MFHLFRKEGGWFLCPVLNPLYKIRLNIKCVPSNSFITVECRIDGWWWRENNVPSLALSIRSLSCSNGLRRISGFSRTVQLNLYAVFAVRVPLRYPLMVWGGGGLFSTTKKTVDSRGRNECIADNFNAQLILSYLAGRLLAVGGGPRAQMHGGKFSHWGLTLNNDWRQ